MTKIKMILGHPAFAYVELSESRHGFWQLRFLDSGLARPPQFRQIQAHSFEEAEHRAEMILGLSNVFTGLNTLVGRLPLGIPSFGKQRGRNGNQNGGGNYLG